MKITDVMKKEAIDGLKERRDKLNRNEKLGNIIGEKLYEKFLRNNDISYEIIKGLYNMNLYKINNDIVEVKTSKFIKGGRFNNLGLMYGDKRYEDNKKNNISKVVKVFIEGYDREKRFDIDQCENGFIVGEIPYEKIGKLELSRDKYGRTRSYKTKWQELNPVLV